MTDLAFKVVIPARFASTRLPGKPLLQIAGRPMLQFVHDQALGSGAGEVIIATDDQRILVHIQRNSQLITEPRFQLLFQVPIAHRILSIQIDGAT